MSGSKALSGFLLDEKLREARSERYVCQSVSRMALPRERVSSCLRFRVPDRDIEVWKHRSTNKAFYTGLMLCGSVWTCPVCAAKISERRRQELRSAYEQHLASEGKVALLTLTFSHKKTDRLVDTLSKFSKAIRRFISGKRYQKVREQLGLIGSIRAFEITYGSNGFHPHTHTALFYTNDVDLKLIKKELSSLWEKACSAFQLGTNERYALTLEDGEKANDYMSKHGTWGVDRELTKSHIKKGKKESISPFDFLRKFLEDEQEKWLHLFIEYAQALKGKRQLYWSSGLKDRFLIEEQTDEELVVEGQEQADILGLIEWHDWKLIVKKEKRAHVLDLCEKEGFEKVKDYINAIKKENVHFAE